MRDGRKLTVVLIGVLLLACSCPLTTELSPTAIPVPTSTVASPTITAAPSASPTAAIPTPSVPQVMPISVNVNCRAGPDLASDVRSVLLVGHVAQIAGKNDAGTWWYIHDPDDPAGFCWVAASAVNAAGDLRVVPVEAALAPLVTNVTVEVSAPSVVVCGEPNALQFSGTITTEGAATVEFQWEIRGDKSNRTPPETLTFNQAGTSDVPDPGAYSLDCGSYSVTLHVLSPNDISAIKTFKVKP